MYHNFYVKVNQIWIILLCKTFTLMFKWTINTLHVISTHKTVRKKILNYILTSKVVETVNNVSYDQNYNLVLMGIWWVYNDCNTKSLTAEKNNVYYPIIRFLFYSGKNDGSKFWHETTIWFQIRWKQLNYILCWSYNFHLNI